MASGMACACSTTSGGNWCGRWCLRMTISTSTPKSSGWPRISITRPTGTSPRSGYSSSSTLTTMPSSSATVETFGRRDADAVDRGAGGRELHALGDLDPLLDALVVRHHVLAAPADVEFADHGGVGALEHLDDLAIGAAVGLDARDAHHHAVAVHGLFGRFGRNEDVARRCPRWAARRSGTRSRRGAC